MSSIDIDTFLRVCDDFKLGDLDTEKSNPRTVGLSNMAKMDIDAGIDAIKDVDLAALRVMLDKVPQIEALASAIRSTFKQGGRVYLFGCGATGRLSLSLEWLCRSGLVPYEMRDRVISFMSGGDAALIRSIEAFEDFPEYGARQLADLGFSSGDLLISTSEGGETPIVIGCTEFAASHVTKSDQSSGRKPFFLYCNSTQLLVDKVERAKRVIENDAIETICLETGPQALSGSTRMQASSVLMLAVGMALEKRGGCKEDIRSRLELFIVNYEKLSLKFLAKFIELESTIYNDGNQIVYQTDTNFGMTVLTDTTERSPTFALCPYENINSTLDPGSLCYLVMKNANNSSDALKKLLLRDPRPLEWEFCAHQTNLDRILGFDMSPNIIKYRKSRFPEKHQFTFSIDWNADRKSIDFKLDQYIDSIWMGQFADILQVNLVLKMMLNIHSTLVMGRIGRYESNVMTFVRPSNYKLIDRSIRYINQILKETLNISGLTYEFVARKLADTYAEMAADEPVVLKTVQAIAMNVDSIKLN